MHEALKGYIYLNLVLLFLLDPAAPVEMRQDRRHATYEEIVHVVGKATYVTLICTTDYHGKEGSQDSAQRLKSSH